MINPNPVDQPMPGEKDFAGNALIRVTWNSRWDIDHVRHLACRAKNHDERSKGRPGDSARCRLGHINRWAVNLLRHRYSNYDRLLEEFGRDSPHVAGRLNGRIKAMVFQTWPDLADLASDEKWCRRTNPPINTHSRIRRATTVCRSR